MVAQNIGNQIFSDSKNQHWAAWGFALFWNAMVWFAIIMGGENILRAFEENPIFYFFVTFPFIGLWLIVHAIQESMSWSKYQQTPITLNPFPTQVGGKVSGYLALPLTVSEVSRAEVSLMCLRRYYQHSSENSWEESPLWQDKITVRSDNHGGKIRIRFSFDPPVDLPESSPESEDFYLWRLRIHVPLKGNDFERQFEVPMAANTASNPESSRYKADTSYIVDMPDLSEKAIPVISKTGIGTKFYYAYGRSKSMGVGLMLAGFLVGLFGYFFFKDFLNFLPITTGLMWLYVTGFAIALFVFGLFIIAHSLTAEVGLMGIQKEQKIFGFSFSETLRADEIIDLVIEKSGSMTTGNETQIWYKINALMQTGKEIQVGDDLDGHRYAESIRQQMLTALGMTWQPATPNTPDSAVENMKKPTPIWLQALKKLLSYSFMIAFIIDITKVFS